MRDNKNIFMIVDYDHYSRELFCEAVTEINSSNECLMAQDGEVALKTLRNGIKQLPDFIFLDLNMPLMDGKTCLTELKKDERLKNIPVIIFSTSSSPNEIAETNKLGALYFMVKPTNFRLLQKQIIFVMNENWSLRIITSSI